MLLRSKGADSACSNTESFLVRSVLAGGLWRSGQLSCRGQAFNQAELKTVCAQVRTGVSGGGFGKVRGLNPKVRGR